MSWLRRDKDCIGLVVVWGILLQSLLLSFSSGLHAATLASQRGASVVLCTAKGAVIARQLPGQSHNKADCSCCAMSCRLACGGSCGGILPIASHVPAPASGAGLVTGIDLDPPARKSPAALAARPRAPPLA